jgi:glycosyltransferase involved in cell wall biosynthesis
MKILLMAPIWGYEGGVERYLVDCIVEFTRMGHACSLVYGNKSSRAIEEEVANLLHSSYEISSVRQYETAADAIDVRRLSVVLEDERPDIIFMSEVKNFALLSRLKDYGGLVPMSHANTLVCMRTSNTTFVRKSICTHNVGYRCLLHGCLVRKNPGRSQRLSLTSVSKQHTLLGIYKSIGIHIVPSNYSKQRLIQHGFHPAQVTVNGYFTNIQPLTPVPLNQPPVVSFMGHMHRYKGADYLLRALKRVSTPFKCTIIGDGVYLPHCKELTRKLGLTNVVDFPGWLSTRDIAAHLCAATVSTVPSIWPETFGIVGLEAMMCSKPVVAFDVGGISDWLKDGKTGYLVPVKDTTLFAQRLETLLRDPHTAANMGAEGRRYVMSTFTKEQHFERLLSVFEKASVRTAHGQDQLTILA